MSGPTGAVPHASRSDCRTIAGNCGSSPAVFAPNDVTNSGQYVQVGNNACQLAVGQPKQPTALTLRAIGGNPFRGATRLRYTVPEAGRVKLEVFSVSGQRVRTLLDQDLEAGTYEAPFSLRGGASAPLPMGVYMVRLSAHGESSGLRMIGLD